MSMTSKTARNAVSGLAVALVLLVGPSLSASAMASTGKPTPYQQATAQQFMKKLPGGSGPTRPGALQTRGGTSGGAASNQGCHDGASQTSYEGPCDNHPEYEATGGCESDATGTSTPGNCPNSSEP